MALINDKRKEERQVMNNTNRIWRIKQSAEPKTLDIYIYGYVECDSEDATTGSKIKSKPQLNTSRRNWRSIPM